MNDLKQPANMNVAREALKRLLVRHLPLTPENFQSCFQEIAGMPNHPTFPEGPLYELAADLRARNDTQVDALNQLTSAITRQSWQGVREALSDFARAEETARRKRPEAALRLLPGDFAARLASFIESVRPALGDDDARTVRLVGELVAMLKQPAVELATIQNRLGHLAHLAHGVAEEQAEIKGSLLNLLHLIIENIGELSLDDSWLKGQIDGLLASVAPPLNLRHLDEMERRLHDVLEKQSRVKARSVEAQAEMRHMLTEFIEQLGAMNCLSSAFEKQIEDSIRQIDEASDLAALRPLLDQVVGAAHAMAEESARSRGQLRTLQERVAATEAELIQLHHELDNASALARHDPLTDVLNRKGLEEALAREISSMRRKDSPLSISLLDIDNFKKLNDRHGHAAGDGALIHLTEITRRHLRPHDTLARYGGEEFVILMPDTQLDEAIEAMVRLQRELTKAIYLAANEKILITFSAGVAQLLPGEPGVEAIRRADQAMYLAKRAGKNRVFGA